MQTVSNQLVAKVRQVRFGTLEEAKEKIEDWQKGMFLSRFLPKTYTPTFPA